MKFGISFFLDMELDTITECCKRAEDLGFDSIWFPDHYFDKDNAAVQGWVAAQTKKVRIGADVASPFLRHPAALASWAATIDEISNGRAVLGIGSGGDEFAVDLGIRIEKPLAACRETIEIAKALWSGKTVTYQGKTFTLQNARLHYATRPDIPIYLAGRGPRMLKLGGELCDGVLTHGVASKYAEYVASRVRIGAERRGRNWKTIDIAVISPVAPKGITQDYRERLKAASLSMAGGEYSMDLLGLYGLTEERVTPIRESFRKRDFSKAAALVDDTVIDAFCISGSVDQCIQRIEELQKAGVTYIIISSRWAKDRLHQLVELLGQEIVGYFKEK